MKLSIGVPSYKVPAGGDFAGAKIPGQKGKDLHLTVLTLDAMRARQAELPTTRAIPTHVAYDPVNQKLWVHPLPKGEFQFEVMWAGKEKDWGKLNDPVMQPVKVAGSTTLTLPKKA